MGVDCGIIEKSGSWFSYNGERLGQGRDSARNLIESDEALAAELEAKIAAASKAETAESADDDLDEEDLDIRLLNMDLDDDQ